MIGFRMQVRLLLLAEGFAPMFTKVERNWLDHMRNLNYDVPDMANKIKEIRNG